MATNKLGSPDVGTSQRESLEADVDQYFKDLIEASSLGTPAARRIRASASDAIVEDIRRRLSAARVQGAETASGDARQRLTTRRDTAAATDGTPASRAGSAGPVPVICSVTAHAAPARPPRRRPRAGSPERALKFLPIDFGTTMSAASMTVGHGPRDGEGDDSAGLYELPMITLGTTGSGKTLAFAVLLRSLLDNAFDQAFDAARERAAAARDRAVVMPQAPAWRLYRDPWFADLLADYRNRAPGRDRVPVYLQRVSARAIPGAAFSAGPESYPRRADDLLARWWRRDLAARSAARNRGHLADADLAAHASGYAGRRHSRALQHGVLQRIAAEAAFPMTELLASDLAAKGLAPGAAADVAGAGLWALDASGHLRVPGSYAVPLREAGYSVHACGHVRAAITTQGDEREAGRVTPMTGDTVRLWLADSSTGRACLLVAALADPGQVVPVTGRPRPGGSDGDDEFMAGLLIRMWALASGRALRSDIRPELLSAEELIRFWADDLQDAFQGSGLPWAECRHEDRGDGVLVIVPPPLDTQVLASAWPCAGFLLTSDLVMNADPRGSRTRLARSLSLLRRRGAEELSRARRAGELTSGTGSCQRLADLFGTIQRAGKY